MSWERLNQLGPRLQRREGNGPGAWLEVTNTARFKHVGASFHVNHFLPIHGLSKGRLVISVWFVVFWGLWQSWVPSSPGCPFFSMSTSNTPQPTCQSHTFHTCQSFPSSGSPCGSLRVVAREECREWIPASWEKLTCFPGSWAFNSDLSSKLRLISAKF